MIIDLLKQEKNDSRPLMFRIKSNAPRIYMKYEIIEENGRFPHLGITARNGLVILYRTEENKNWKNVNIYSRKPKEIIRMFQMIENITSYELLIYGPILGEIKKLTMEVMDEYEISIIGEDDSYDMLFVGGSNTLGIGCTTVGVMFPSILSRKNDLLYKNISYNNINYLDKVYNELKDQQFNKKIKYGIIELDYYKQDDKIVEDYLIKTVELMNQLCQHVIGWFCISNKRQYKIDQVYDLLKEQIDTNQITIVDISSLYDEFHIDICTHSYNYINDTGNIMIYKELNKIVKGIN